jgi:prokaryotic ubiquitin-like protein Pup
MAQEHKQPRKSTETESAEAGTDPAGAAPTEAVSERKERLDEDIDAILDEIDDVLETNAEDFVKSFIQKGGQ